MLDPIIHDRLQMILESIEMIETRMRKIQTAADFIKDEQGRTIMDSICMRLQFIGESLKKIDKTDENFLSEKIEMDLSPVIRFRDFIAHHYEKTDYEIVFDTCKFHLPQFKDEIIRALKTRE